MAADLGRWILPRQLTRREHKRLAEGRLTRLRERKEARRIGSLDRARGIALGLVVIVQGIAASGPQDGNSLAAGLAAFLHPFALPAFLAIIGLFAPRSSASLAWPRFLRRHIAPFALTYAVWAAILLVAASVAAAHLPSLSFADAARALAAPFATLPLLWLAPLCLTFFKLVRAQRPALVLAATLALAIAHSFAGVSPIAEAMQAFFYFYVAALLAPFVLEFARRPAPAAHVLGTFLALWAALEGFFVSGFIDADGRSAADLPVVDIALGLAGTAAVLVAASLVGRYALAPLRAIGRRWIVAYPLLLAAWALAERPILAAAAHLQQLPHPLEVGLSVAAIVFLLGTLAEQFWSARRLNALPTGKTKQA